MNNGGLWNISNTGLINSVNALIADGTNLFAGTSNGVYISTNNGGLWTIASTGLPTSPVYSLAVNGSNIFAATDSGVYKSANNGNQWTAINTGLPLGRVRYLAISGTNIYAALNRQPHLEELWKRPLSEVNGIEEESEDALFNLYPNPTNGKFRISNSGFKITGIEVYNSIGENIFSLSDSATMVSNEMNFSGYGKGIYFLKIYGEGRVIVRKIILN
jgi:Secretion system C-terminal sorting domain